MIPKTMKAVVVIAPEKVEVKEVSTPVPVEGEVLVRIDNCLICTWEQRIFSGSGADLPFIPGHEVSGVVAAVPKETIANVTPGQKCVVKTYDSCGSCEFCFRGLNNLCSGQSKKRTFDGIAGTGGMARYIAIAADRIYPLPVESIDLELAAFAEPLACCLHSIEQADVSFGEDVVVVGAGVMGQLLAILARLRGARVIVVEIDKARRELAMKMGAHESIDPSSTDWQAELSRLTSGRGPHVVQFTINNLAMASQYIKALAPAGRLVYYGSFRPSEDVPFNPNDIHYTEKVITGSYSPTVRSFWQASQMLGHGLVDVKPFLTECFDMNEAQRAFERAMSTETLRVLIRLSD
ncbi:MAG: zinc-binding dehydrogenase [Fastidiosipila sp.]|jgi:threonine dehydrogenase-like Zn-dependent dehydrogenase|nr:zinc-binding dehydrogenase [Fastidiosipila sp.]